MAACFWIAANPAAPAPSARKQAGLAYLSPCAGMTGACLVLIGGGHTEEGIKIMTTALDHFPIGNVGQDGAHAAEPSTLILSGF
jgi:hypothetical protein